MSDSSAPRPPEKPSELKRWLVVALVLSVAFNLFALGFIAARAWKPHGPHHSHEGHGPFLGPRGLMREGFGPEARPVLDKIMKRHRETLRSEHGELRRARRAVRDALLNEPFDAAQLERALSALRARTDSSQAHMHKALVELASTLPREQRKLLARRALAFDALGMSGQSQAAPEH
jgi:Spy/CpxP family protein refolding chaperone